MNTNLYEKDFYAWTMKNTELMRQGKLSEIDVENIAEELESMGRSEKRRLIKWRSKMKVEAIKVESGFLIPFNEALGKIKEDKILIEVEIIEHNKLEEGYAILDELVGFCESSRTDASVNHDAIIYESRSQK